MSISDSPFSTPLEALPPPALNPQEGAHLVRIGLEALQAHLLGGRLEPEPPDGGLLHEPAAAFVSLYVRNELRGCLGVLRGREPLWLAVRDIAVRTATSDPRFQPIAPSDCRDLDIEISVLGPLIELPADSREFLVQRLRLGEHGLSVRSQEKSGLLLPQVPLKHGWDVFQFLAQTCRKAGLLDEAWRERGVELSVFRCTVFRGSVHSTGAGREP